MKDIKILGMGCPKCVKLGELAELAAGEMNIEYKIEKVADLARITEYGVIVTPALVVDGEVKVAGKLPDIEEIKRFLA